MEEQTTSEQVAKIEPDRTLEAWRARDKEFLMLASDSAIEGEENLSPEALKERINERKLGFVLEISETVIKDTGRISEYFPSDKVFQRVIAVLQEPTIRDHIAVRTGEYAPLFEEPGIFVETFENIKEKQIAAHRRFYLESNSAEEKGDLEWALRFALMSLVVKHTTGEDRNQLLAKLGKLNSLFVQDK